MASPLPNANSILLVHDRYKVGRRLSQRRFCEVHEGTDQRTQEPVAIKFEEKTSSNPSLPVEFQYYMELNNTIVGIPRFYHYEDKFGFNVLVMELLGASLEDLFDKYQRKFTMKTVMQLAQQMIQQVAAVHKKGILHRNLKPGHFLMGRKGSDGEKVLNIVDFRLAKHHTEKTNDYKSRHIEMGESRFLVGTPRYCSINAHKMRTLSRRDDLESVGYVLVYLAKGRLPWQGQTGTSEEEKLSKIHRLKIETKTKLLCDKLPACFAEYIDYVRVKLGFKDTPDYDYLANLFKKGYSHAGFKPQDKDSYDWDNIKDESVGSREFDSNATLPIPESPRR